MPCHFLISANQIAWSKLLIQIHLWMTNSADPDHLASDEAHLIWIYTGLQRKGYPGPAGSGLKFKSNEAEGWLQ